MAGATGRGVGIPAVDWFVAFLLALYDTGERASAMLRVAPHDVELAGFYSV